GVCVRSSSVVFEREARELTFILHLLIPHTFTHNTYIHLYNLHHSENLLVSLKQRKIKALEYEYLTRASRSNTGTFACETATQG
mgnify:CR=1